MAHTVLSSSILRLKLSRLQKMGLTESNFPFVLLHRWRETSWPATLAIYPKLLSNYKITFFLLNCIGHVHEAKIWSDEESLRIVRAVRL